MPTQTKTYSVVTLRGQRYPLYVATPSSAVVALAEDGGKFIRLAYHDGSIVMVRASSIDAVGVHTVEVPA